MGSGNELQRQQKGPLELRREKGEGNTPGGGCAPGRESAPSLVHLESGVRVVVLLL